ncbi:MAG: endonuclease/exonuclease/phosphatase family protein [Bdellovibrio sp.]|nr:endonuclease/exonuclease/phosphatase family protein [Bdellovibrio sp.]
MGVLSRQLWVVLLLGLLIQVFPVSVHAFGWFTVPDKAHAVLSLGADLDPARALDPNEVDILVWNTYKAKNPSWSADYAFLSLDKEIVVLQEAFLNAPMKEAFENQDTFHYKMATSFVYKKSKIPTGTATGATVYPVKHYYKKTRDVEIIGLTPKALMFTEYPLRGRGDTLLVINIHALNSVPAFILKRHLEDGAVEIAKHHGPVIFAGDFNTWSSLKIKTMRKVMNTVGMSEVQFPNGGERMRASITNKIIDYIFVRGLEASDSWVWGNLQGADHKAMTVRLKVK